MTEESTRNSATTVQDRQRQRASRGIGTKAGANGVGPSLPSPPRRRRPALGALAVLLIVGGAALAGLLALRLDSREPVIVLKQDVAVGTQITADMLSTAEVASEGLMLIPEDQANTVIGTYARTSLSSGQLLDTSMLVKGAPFNTTAVRVGVPLTEGQVPGDLRSGDQVRIIRISDGSAVAQPLAVGLFLTSSSKDGDRFGGSGSSASATLLVPATAADAVVDAAGNDKLGLALIKRGVSVEDAGLLTLGNS
ncbi:hypothetical protein GCM10022234_27410 [Aeromicrobium panaciterrae]|uniref:SAF domain-containing protein n=1 Tax=Aeromicrobium panaciterrae TaxID=363861 RepID=UPI0031CEBD4B